MAITKSIGKNTLGGGKKMNVQLHTYSRSTHDLSSVWRNTQSPGTLVPFMVEVALPGDTWEIGLDANVMTHPTVGPLFGSFKLQLDVFEAPMRLYQAQLHNNALKIGLDMSKVKLPIIGPTNINTVDYPTKENEYSQINPSCLLSYLGIRGWTGRNANINGEHINLIKKNAIPLIAYFDIFKNYYANKQEENFYTIGQEQSIVEIITVNNQAVGAPIFNGYMNELQTPKEIAAGDTIKLQLRNPILGDDWKDKIYINLLSNVYTLSNGFFEHDLAESVTINDPRTEIIIILKKASTLYGAGGESQPTLVSFPLEDIDECREKIYQQTKTAAFDITSQNALTYLFQFIERRAGKNPTLKTFAKQFGLAVKTYQSDIFNNWINTDWIDGPNGISAVTAVDTSSGSLSLDTLNLAQKVYNMLNRIAVSDGTYKSWLETVYTNQYIENCETPIYMGGMSQEIVFQEVVSNAAAENEPLGTLAGRGVLHGDSRKGGKVIIKCNEPAYIMGICSITPRIDYSQGNKWFNEIKTMNDLHKPQLDGIGYQDLLEVNMAYWAQSTRTDSKIDIINVSPGKSVAWINYMTAVNELYGEFCEKNSENFMVLDRKYEMNDALETNGQFRKIKDITTYIDPAKYNYIFADTSLSAMNFWVQIRKDIKVRRKISAKQIPNL